MRVSAHLFKPAYINLFEALAMAQFQSDQRIFGKDLTGRYIYANDAFARDAGVPVDYLLGKMDEDLAWGKDAEKCRSDDARVIRAGIDTFRKESIHCAGKMTLKVMLRKTLVRDEANAVIGVAGIYTPIKRLKMRNCLACSEATQKALDSVLLMLSPEQMAHFEEQAEARNAARGGDAFEQLELPE